MTLTGCVQPRQLPVQRAARRLIQPTRGTHAQRENTFPRMLHLGAAPRVARAAPAASTASAAASTPATSATRLCPRHGDQQALVMDHVLPWLDSHRQPLRLSLRKPASHPKAAPIQRHDPPPLAQIGDQHQRFLLSRLPPPPPGQTGRQPASLNRQPRVCQRWPAWPTWRVKDVAQSVVAAVGWPQSWLPVVVRRMTQCHP